MSVARKMLRSGANPGAVCDGFPALCVATIAGHAGTVALLCERGADPNATVRAESDLCGATAMYLAAHGGHAHVVPLLAKVGGDVDMALVSLSLPPSLPPPPLSLSLFLSPALPPSPLSLSCTVPHCPAP
eukprot:COSAG03_NODE_7398_length_923_cov_40.695388_2_plen_130_part_00